MDNDTHLNHFKEKYHMAHKLATKKWDYQGKGLGKEEIKIRRPIDLVPNVLHQGLGFGCFSHEAWISVGTSENNNKIWLISKMCLRRFSNKCTMI